MTPGAEGELAPGTLVLIATPIGNLGDLSTRGVAVLARADLICCEDTRRTGRLLEHVGLRDRRLVSLHGHNEASRVTPVLAALERGSVVALVSDAGTPLVSDPGKRLVSAAIAAGHKVTAVPGPSAALAALVLADLGTDRWRFEGFLPRKGAERRRRLVEMANAPHPSVFYEAPTRLLATLTDLASVAGGARRVVVARELTKLHEEVWRGTCDDAVARVAAVVPRGEHVVVLDGAPPAVAPAHEALVGAISRLLAVGLGRREAVRAAEVLLGASHREAYQASLSAPAGVAGPDAGDP